MKKLLAAEVRSADVFKEQGNSVKNRKSTTISARWLIRIASWACGTAFTLFLFNKTVTWASGALISIFVSTMSLGQQASVSALPTAKLDTEIVEVSEMYRKAVLNADLPTLTGLYQADAVEMPFFHPPIAGRAAIAQFYQTLLKGPSQIREFSFTHLETARHGEIAYDIGTYKRSMWETSSGPIEATGTYIAILKRNTGAFRIAYLMYNCDRPSGSIASAGSH